MARKSVFPGFESLSGQRRDVIAALVRERRRLGLSQTEVAARMNTSQSSVARLETGDCDLRVSTLQRYAAAVGRQLQWRMTGGDRS